MSVVTGLASASQSATGKNTGCDEESSKRTTKRHKVVKGAHSTNDNEAVGDEVRDWKFYVFACMKKPQFENWIRRKNFAAKLAGKCSVILTPEQVRRYSERWYRRVKKQLRRTCHSSRPHTEDLETSDYLEFDFDDMDVESKNCSSVSKELSQCETVNVSNNVERCSVYSTRMEHPALPGTERSEVVQSHVNFSSVDECNDETVYIEKTDDLMCDKEVSIILKQDDMDEVSTSNIGNDDADNSVLGSVTSALTGKDIPVKAEERSDCLVEDQVTICEEEDMETGITGRAGCIKQQDAAKESPVAEVLDQSVHLRSESEGNGDKVIGGENEVVHGLGCEEANNGKDGPQDGSREEFLAADIKSASEAEAIRAVDVSANAPHNQDVERIPGEVKEDQSGTEASIMDTVAEYANMDVTDTAEVTDDHESHQEPRSVARRDIQVVENALAPEDGHCGEDKTCSAEDESVGEGNKVESRMGTDDAEDKPAFTATSEPQTSIDGNVHKATVVLEQDKTGSVMSGGTNTTMTNRSPKVSTLVTSTAQLSQSQSGSLTTIVSTSNQPNISELPVPQRPSWTTPIVPVTSPFPAFHPFPPHAVWPVARYAGPFTTTGIVPSQAPIHPQCNHGFDPSWVDHPLHVPIPVGCVRSHSTYDDICPPGTENMSLEPSSEQADLAPGPETQEETSISTDDKQLHQRVLDNSVVTALMQFYSEIEEVEGCKSNGVEGTDDTTETNSSLRVPKPVEESTQTKRSKSFETSSDMEVETDCEDSDKGVSEDAEMSETGGVARAGKLKGKNEEVESTGPSTKPSQFASGIVCSKEDITVVEKQVDRTELENPVMMNPETTEDETLAKNPEVETERTQVTKTGITGDTTQVEYPNMTMSKSLADNPDNSMDRTLSENPTTDETAVENGTLAENANVTGDRTLIEKDSVPIETILAEEHDVAMNETLVDSLDITVKGPQMEDPCIVAGGTHVEEPPSKSMLAEEPDVAMNETLVDSLDIAVDRTQMGDPFTVVGGTHAEGPNGAVMEALEEELPLSPIEPLFMASAEQTIFSSIGDLRNLLGQSSTFDRIAEEAITSTVSCLEHVLRQAYNSYQESSSCPSDSGMSVGEDVSAPSRSYSNIPVSMIPLQDGDASTTGSVPGWSLSSCSSGGTRPQVVTATGARGNDRTGTNSYISKGLSVNLLFR